MAEFIPAGTVIDVKAKAEADKLKEEARALCDKGQG